MDADAPPYMEAVIHLAECRRRYSEAFLRFKGAKKDVTDRQAEHQAYIECGTERDVAEAAVEMLRSRLSSEA